MVNETETGGVDGARSHVVSSCFVTESVNIGNRVGSRRHGARRDAKGIEIAAGDGHDTLVTAAG